MTGSRLTGNSTVETTERVQPTAMVVYLNNAVPWSSENPMQVLLLDETDQGFYDGLQYMPNRYCGSKEDIWILESMFE
jgi:hypothetical protein